MMYKLLPALIALSLPLCSQATEIFASAGNYQFDGMLSFSAGDEYLGFADEGMGDTHQNRFSASLAPGFELMPMDGLSLRLAPELTLSYIRPEEGSPQTNLLFDTFAGPVFYMTFTESIYTYLWPFGGIGLGRYAGDTAQEINDSTTRYSVGVEPGLIFVAGSMYARLGVAYKRLWVRGQTTFEEDGATFDIERNWNRFLIRFGIGFFFGRR